MTRSLPRWMHLKHGRYYLVRENKWHQLPRNLHDALVEYARLTAGPDGSALADLVQRTLLDMKLTVAASTLKNYQSAARRVLKAFAKFTPQQVKPTHIAQFLDHNKAKPSMANLMHSFLSGMFIRGVRWGIVETNPVRDIKKFKTEGRDRLITDAEFKAIRENATPTLQSLMDLAHIIGQRIGDVMKIRYADITEVGIYVKQQKTKARRLIEMTPDLAAAIAQAREIHQSIKGLTLFHKRDGSPLAYGTIHHQWIKACEAAKVEDANFHDIRAGTATEADERGMDSKGLLGHESEASHKRYLRSKKVKVVTPLSARKS